MWTRKYPLKNWKEAQRLMAETDFSLYRISQITKVPVTTLQYHTKRLRPKKNVVRSAIEKLREKNII